VLGALSDNELLSSVAAVTWCRLTGGRRHRSQEGGRTFLYAFLDEQIVASIKAEQVHGFTLRWRWSAKPGKKKQREILSANDGVCTVSLDDEVMLKDGRAGKVVKLVWPYTEGRTTDIVHVHLGRSHGFYWVKHEELD